jgi:nuclear transport factor 2 (NTF2) superfamily protein
MLIDAVQMKVDSHLEQMLDSDFEVWSGEDVPPISRAEWKTKSAATPVAAYRFRNMAVRDFGNISVVSFLLEKTGKQASTKFVVDVWRNEGDKLAVRYESKPRTPVVGEAPTGKE